MSKWSRLCLSTFLCSTLVFILGATTTPTKPRVQERAPVSGTVVDSSGKPVAGAIVHVQFPPGFKPPTTQPSHAAGHSTTKHAPITTDANGHFTLPHVKVGKRTIVAMERGVGRGETSVNVTASGVTNVSITLVPRAQK